MRLKRLVSASLVLCITAILWIAVCGCEDLGVYNSTTEYYESLDTVTLINAATKESKTYSVEESFYNKESREDFLEGEEGDNKRVEYGEYVYMAIHIGKGLEMDTLALYLNALEGVDLYINVYITESIPSNFRPIGANVVVPETTDATSEETEEDSEETYDDPDYKSSIGEIVLNLKKEEWDSFVLDTFMVNGEVQKSIKIEKDQYILLQFRNNGGAVDPPNHLSLEKAVIKMTNLMVRALEIDNENEAQGG